MKYITTLFIAMALCTTTAALADDITIPTDDDHPFDLTKGIVTSADTHEHFTQNGLEWMRDGDQITFTLQNEQNVDYYDVIVNADTGNNGVTIDFSLKSHNGDVVADTTLSIVNSGWYNPKQYWLQTPAMKQGKYFLTLTFHSTPSSTTGNVKDISFRAPTPINIPTDDDHPFDLTKGLIISSSTKVHFTEHGVENMYDNDQLVYNLQCLEDLDVCNVYVDAATDLYNDIVFLDVNIKSIDGSIIADTTFHIEKKGWYNFVPYALQIRQMKKGKYILTLTYHQSTSPNWGTCNIGSISFKKPQSLKPGDEVQLANAEFDDGYNGWERQGHLWDNPQEFGNKYCVAHFNGGKGVMSQTAYNLPDGTYLLRMNAYDSTPSNPQELDTYIFLNDREKLLKDAYADANGYRNIYRCYEGRDNGNYRRTTDGRFAPTHQVQWNEGLNMAERLYMNCLVAVVTNGMAIFGWKKITDRGTRITLDHAQLIYLSDKIDLSTAELTTLESEQTTAFYKARLSELEQALRTELAAKRPHAPQAVVEANGMLNTDIAYNSDNEIIETILHAEHLLQRLQLPFYDITFSSPSTLADQLTSYNIQANDTIALKLNGTLNDEDINTLKTFNKTMELDLSATTLTALPDQQFTDWRLLTWVTLPKQLETIGNNTFYGCVELRDMQFPTTLRSIGTYAFRYTYNFYQAYIPEGVTAGNGAYRNSGIRRVMLPTTMTDIPYILCCDCYDLIDIQFNKQINIGGSAFENCIALKTINLPEGVERLQDQCFRYCIGLTSVTLPSTLISIARPFHNCHNLTEVTCLAATPPYPNGSHIHGDIGDKGFTLYVTRQAVEEYQEDDYWGEFNVVGIDELPQAYNVLSELTLDMTTPYPADYKPDVNLLALYYYWGNNVNAIGTYGHLTVDGLSTFSTRKLSTVWNPFALRSMTNRGLWGTTHTSIITNGHLRADDVIISLNLYENCWEFITFPFDVRVGDIRYRFPDVPLAIYGYDAQKRAEGKNSETWVRMTADSILHAGQGYIWQTAIPYDQMTERETLYGELNPYFNTFYVDALQNVNKPKFFRNSDVEVTLQKHESEYAHDRSWNFIGNPYPSYFDIQKIETTAPLIVWTFTNSWNGQYRAYSPLDDDLILFPGQAFFVQRPLDQEKLVFHKEGRQHDLSLHYDVQEARTARARSFAYPRQVFNILLTKANDDTSVTLLDADRTRFVINEAATLDYEPGRDASKFFSLNADADHLYTIHNGVHYAIDERPLADGLIRLGLQLPKEGTYTISLGDASHLMNNDGMNHEVTLIDHETGTETDLSTEAYTFHADAGTFDGRFTIRLSGAPNSIQTIGMDTERPSLGDGLGEGLFDLQGRRVSKPQRGIYLRNGKKHVVK